MSEETPSNAAAVLIIITHPPSVNEPNGSEEQFSGADIQDTAVYAEACDFLLKAHEAKD